MGRDITDGVARKSCARQFDGGCWEDVGDFGWRGTVLRAMAREIAKFIIVLHVVTLFVWGTNGVENKRASTGGC